MCAASGGSLTRSTGTTRRPRIALAQAMVGRTLSGRAARAADRRRPFAGVGPEATDIALNRFTYDADAAGLRCPLGAHVRRANPRNGDMPGGEQGAISQLIAHARVRRRRACAMTCVASSRFHRLLRRGREYGERLTLEQALQPGTAEPESGLHFICLNANISRQFEFIQNAWLMGSKFDGLSGESDPLTGNRVADGFTLPQRNGVGRRITGLPAFVTVRGGAYFFLPGLRALRYLASSGFQGPGGPWRVQGGAPRPAGVLSPSRRITPPPSRRSCRPRWR